MPTPRKIVRGNQEPLVYVEESRSYAGSFFFWMMILALCACGYWYYQHMETQNEARRHRQATKAAEKTNAHQRAQSEPHSQQWRAPHPQKSQMGHQGAGMGSKKQL